MHIPTNASAKNIYVIENFLLTDIFNKFDNPKSICKKFYFVVIWQSFFKRLHRCCTVKYARNDKRLILPGFVGKSDSA